MGLKDLYHKFCLKLYMNGKHQYEKFSAINIKKRTDVGEGTVFHPGSSVTNLSGDYARIRIGKNCHLYGMLLTYPYGGSIAIGDYCSLGNYSRIVSTKSIEIGNRVLIAHNVNIIDNISHPLDAALRHEDYKNTYNIGMQPYDLKAADIIIEDDVWIGYNCSILKGVRIGRGAIIGSGSTVTSDVEPWTVNVGNPLRCVRKLEPVDIKM